MKIGELDRRITIEQKSVTTDATYGNQVITWVPLAYEAGSPSVAQKFWANVVDVQPSRSEAVKQGLVTARNQTRITIRYRSDVDSAMRVTVHGETDVIYQIVGGPAMIGRKQWLEMVCEKYSS
jgi:SPP1 family predicted phage head-tail adaptor